MKKLTLLLVFVICFNIGCNMFDENTTKKMWLIFPSAKYVSQNQKIDYPICPKAEHPLSCIDKNGKLEGCCAEGYQYACIADNKCYTEPPVNECAEYLQCTPVKLIITSISPGSVTFSYGQSSRISIKYKNYSNTHLTTLIIKSSLGLQFDGQFEQPINTEEQQTGYVTTDIMIVDKKPDLNSCNLDCSRSGECGPCFIELLDSDSFTLDFALRDEQGEIIGTLLSRLNIKKKTTEDVGDLCDDGSRCCTTNPDCGGGISCTVDAITVPESCECPPNTTYIQTDINHLKWCDCNDC